MSNRFVMMAVKKSSKTYAVNVHKSYSTQIKCVKYIAKYKACNCKALLTYMIKILGELAIK